MQEVLLARTQMQRRKPKTAIRIPARSIARDPGALSVTAQRLAGRGSKRGLTKLRRRRSQEAFLARTRTERRIARTATRKLVLSTAKDHGVHGLIARLPVGVGRIKELSLSRLKRSMEGKLARTTTIRNRPSTATQMNARSIAWDHGAHLEHAQKHVGRERKTGTITSRLQLAREVPLARRRTAHRRARPATLMLAPRKS